MGGIIFFLNPLILYSLKTGFVKGENKIFFRLSQDKRGDMRKARFIGYYEDDGSPLLKVDWPHKEGDIITIYPNNRGSEQHPSTLKYKWRSTEEFVAETIFYRDSEVELIIEKEFDVNDYL